jgi:Family of unknown function (DUF6498)
VEKVWVEGNRRQRSKLEPPANAKLRKNEDERREWTLRVDFPDHRFHITIQLRSNSLASAWPDLLAFAGGLAAARWAGWHTGDLIWSLWLSSLVVGYSTIVWMICQPVFELGAASWRDRALMASMPRALPTFWAILAAGALFGLAFFTIHFGMFHYIHSRILLSFFPITVAGAASPAIQPAWAVYAEVARRYWGFLPSAFLSHRAAFLRKPLSLNGNLSVDTFARGGKFGRLIAEPYQNVLRMHALIFFFFLAHFIGLESFGVYAVVYAVYFFPWRLVERRPTTAASISIASS